MSDECHTCFNKSSDIHACFHGCSYNNCTDCVCNIISIEQITGKIVFKCPQCRKETFNVRDTLVVDVNNPQNENYVRNVKFNKLVSSNIELLNKVLELYETTLMEDNEEIEDEDDDNIIGVVDNIVNELTNEAMENNHNILNMITTAVTTALNNNNIVPPIVYYPIMHNVGSNISSDDLIGSIQVMLGVYNQVYSDNVLICRPNEQILFQPNHPTPVSNYNNYSPDSPDSPDTPMDDNSDEDYIPSEESQS
jgi:hypothetical protein